MSQASGCTQWGSAEAPSAMPKSSREARNLQAGVGPVESCFFADSAEVERQNTSYLFTANDETIFQVGRYEMIAQYQGSERKDALVTAPSLFYIARRGFLASTIQSLDGTLAANRRRFHCQSSFHDHSALPVMEFGTFLKGLKVRSGDRK